MDTDRARVAVVLRTILKKKLLFCTLVLLVLDLANVSFYQTSIYELKERETMMVSKTEIHDCFKGWEPSLKHGAGKSSSLESVTIFTNKLQGMLQGFLHTSKVPVHPPMLLTYIGHVSQYVGS